MDLTVGLVDTLRLIRDTRVDALPNEPPARDPNIRDLEDAGLVRCSQQRWVITGEGIAALQERSR